MDIAVTARRTDTRLSDGRELFYYDPADAPARRPVADTRGLDVPAPQVEMRTDPLTGDVIAYATHRNTRTHLPPADECPLCPTQARTRHRDPGPGLRGRGVREPVPVVRRPGPVRGGLLHQRPPDLVHRAVRRQGPACGRCLGGPDRGAERPARRRAGVLLREPRSRDRRDDAPPARADLRLPVPAAADAYPARPRPRAPQPLPAATCSPTRWPPSGRTGAGWSARTTAGRRSSPRPPAGRSRCTCTRTGRSRT